MISVALHTFTLFTFNQREKVRKTRDVGIGLDKGTLSPLISIHKTEESIHLFYPKTGLEPVCKNDNIFSVYDYKWMVAMMVLVITCPTSNPTR